MSSNVVNQQPYIKTTKNFSDDPESLSLELNITYLELANAINDRVIGTFPTKRPAVTGENWFVSQNKKQQSLRQVYTFTSTAAIDHFIPVTRIDGFTRMFGTYTDGTNWYGLIPGSNVAIAGQVSFYVSPTQIIFAIGAGAPTVTSGRLVLEWLSDRIQSNND